tara:strand:+ start:713 stop:886 length:174 start_codon:yes stop_codon:yes gene_type:complete
MAVSNSQNVCTTDAERISVAKTRSSYGGTPIADSAVKSVTKGLRLAYPAVECNITNV